MRKVGGVWQINDEDEFWSECSFASKVIDYVEKNENTEKIKWFFKSCTANWDDGKYFVLFHSWKVPGYENYLLSVSVQELGKGKYEIQTIKRTEGKADE